LAEFVVVPLPSWPDELMPQHTAVPKRFNAQLKLPPSETGEVTKKDCVTVGAGENEPFPAWLAAIVQAPCIKTVTVFPLTVQFAGVVELRLTASPELAVAVMAKGADPMGKLGCGLNVMVCAAGLTVKD
jgi:hypothetical protein